MSMQAPKAIMSFDAFSAKKTITESIVNATSTKLVVGQAYKIFDRVNNGKLVYTAAEFLGTSDGQHQFKLLNLPASKGYSIPVAEEDNFFFTPSNFKKDA